MGIQRCYQNLLKSVKVLEHAFKNWTPVIQMSEKYPTVNERKAFSTNSLALTIKLTENENSSDHQSPKLVFQEFHNRNWFASILLNYTIQ